MHQHISQAFSQLRPSSPANFVFLYQYHQFRGKQLAQQR